MPFGESTWAVSENGPKEQRMIPEGPRRRRRIPPPQRQQEAYGIKRGAESGVLGVMEKLELLRRMVLQDVLNTLQLQQPAHHVEAQAQGVEQLQRLLDDVVTARGGKPGHQHASGELMERVGSGVMRVAGAVAIAHLSIQLRRLLNIFSTRQLSTSTSDVKLSCKARASATLGEGGSCSPT